MSLSVDNFRLDWRPEIKKITPYLKGKGGVVRIDYGSEEAAVDKFNYILKEDFGSNGNGSWLSLRIDDDWSTTYTVGDQIDAFAMKLAEAGIAVNWPTHPSLARDILSGNESGGDMNLTMIGNTIYDGSYDSSLALRLRISAVCDAMRRYVANGGHFMIIINDMPMSHQGRFWKLFWNAGLREAGGDDLLLFYYVGPRCGMEPHQDAPAPHLRLSLPAAITGDDSREGSVYDDVFDLFTGQGCGREEAAMAAHSMVSGHGHSMRAVHIALSKLVMRLISKNGN